MPEKEEKRLNTVRRFLNLNISKEKELQQIVELAARICNSSVAMITFMDHEFQHIMFSFGTAVKVVPYKDTFCQYTILQKDVLIIKDASADERVMHNPFVIKDPNIRFYAGSPLITHDDQNMGTLCVFNQQPGTLSEIQEKMLQRLGKQVIQLIEFDASLQLLKLEYETSIQEEDKLRSFFESCSSVHLLLDKQLCVLSFNKVLLDILGNNYQIPIAEGMECHEYIEPSFLEEFLRNCGRALKNEIIKTENVIPSPQGDIFWHLTYEPAVDSDGNIVGVSYTGTDITQAMRHGNTVTKQENAFLQIERIISGELHQPLKQVKSAMAKIKEEGYPENVNEFAFLESTVHELGEKFNSMFLIPPVTPHNFPIH
ncbi:MAG: GAF domain-containing protein [Pedobacter sp.]|nr:GAF domain-containing protein [Pedobacter sp.]